LNGIKVPDVPNTVAKLKVISSADGGGAGVGAGDGEGAGDGAGEGAGVGVGWAQAPSNPIPRTKMIDRTVSFCFISSSFDLHCLRVFQLDRRYIS
jgi:hypothetical protein